MNYVTSLLDLCGQTPLVNLQRMSEQQNVFLKLEKFTPGKSIKDRPVLEMITAAEERGLLKPGMTIVESTSGNTGIAIALYGRLKGYRVLCIVDENIPIEKLEMLQAYGADVELIRGTPELKNADLTEYRIVRIKQLLAENANYFNLNQYENIGNPNAHEKYTASEILEQAPANLKAVVLSVGTGGTVTGISRGIKALRPDLLIYGVEPAGSTIFGGTKGPYLQQGPGNYFVPAIMDYTHIDHHMKVDDLSAFRTARDLAKKEGLLLGGSSGAVTYAALQIAAELGETGSVIAVCPDAGEKYLDTVFSDEWWQKNGLL